jgi:RNA polymerase sigma-70 factor (ECF subfamily)
VNDGAPSIAADAPGAALGGPGRIRYAAAMAEATDEALMLRYAGGDAAAFEALYARHRTPLYRYIARQAGDDALANDLYQATWERVIRARQRYRPDAPFGAWLFRIARNQLIDHWRSQKPTVAADDVPLAADAPDPPERHDADASRALLRRTVSELPDDQRDAMLLKLDGGFSLQEIAVITGVGRETVKSRLRYAVRKIRQVMKP